MKFFCCKRRETTFQFVRAEVLSVPHLKSGAASERIGVTHPSQFQTRTLSLPRLFDMNVSNTINNETVIVKEGAEITAISNEKRSNSR